MTTLLQIAGPGLAYDSGNGVLFVDTQVQLAGASVNGMSVSLAGSPQMQPGFAGQLRIGGTVSAQSVSTGDGVSWDVQVFVVRNNPAAACRMVAGGSISPFAVDVSMQGCSLALVDGQNGPMLVLTGLQGDTIVGQGLLTVTGNGLVVPNPADTIAEDVLLDANGNVIYDPFSGQPVFGGGNAGDGDLVNTPGLAQVDLQPASRADIIQALNNLPATLLTLLAQALPTTVPPPGQLWNYNGAVRVSDGIAPPGSGAIGELAIGVGGIGVGG